MPLTTVANKQDQQIPLWARRIFKTKTDFRFGLRTIENLRIHKAHILGQFYNIVYPFWLLEWSKKIPNDLISVKNVPGHVKWTEVIIVTIPGDTEPTFYGKVVAVLPLN